MLCHLVMTTAMTRVQAVQQAPRPAPNRQQAATRKPLHPLSLHLTTSTSTQRWTPRYETGVTSHMRLISNAERQTNSRCGSRCGCHGLCMQIQSSEDSHHFQHILKPLVTVHLLGALIAAG
jgi:hypothetical protein